MINIINLKEHDIDVSYRRRTLQHLLSDDEIDAYFTNFEKTFNNLPDNYSIDGMVHSGNISLIAHSGNKLIKSGDLHLNFLRDKIVAAFSDSNNAYNVPVTYLDNGITEELFLEGTRTVDSLRYNKLREIKTEKIIEMWRAIDSPETHDKIVRDFPDYDTVIKKRIEDFHNNISVAIIHELAPEAFLRKLNEIYFKLGYNDEKLRIVHGDFSPHNTLIKFSKRKTVMMHSIDPQVALYPPMMDLAWWVMRCPRHEDLDDEISEYEEYLSPEEFAELKLCLFFVAVEAFTSNIQNNLSADHCDERAFAYLSKHSN